MEFQRCKRLVGKRDVLNSTNHRATGYTGVTSSSPIRSLKSFLFLVSSPGFVNESVEMPRNTADGNRLEVYFAQPHDEIITLQVVGLRQGSTYLLSLIVSLLSFIA